MKSIAITGSNHQEGHFADIQRLLDIFVNRGFRLFIRRRLADYLKEHSVAVHSVISVVDDFPLEAQGVVSIGGDGTFLRTAQWVEANERPILGINTGHLGFLASYSLDEAEELINVLESDRGRLERRSLLAVSGSVVPPNVYPFALNEVAVMKGGSPAMLNLTTVLDGYPLADYLSDGLVISTPTGSTAYNLSVGGPIIQPTLGCMVLSPVAPHSLTMRPLVVSGTSVIEITAYSRAASCRVSLDGRAFVMPTVCEDPNESPVPDRESRELPVLRIERAPFAVVVIRRPDMEFPTLLREKLLWGQR